MASKTKTDTAADPTLGSALDAAGVVGTWETDLRTGIVCLRGSLAGLVGIESKRAAGGVALSTFFEGIHIDDRQRVSALVGIAHRSAGRFEAEFRTIGRDGCVRWVAARGQVEADSHGHGWRCMGVAVDVTDTRRTGPISDEDATELVTRVVTAVVNARSAIDVLGAPG